MTQIIGEDRPLIEQPYDKFWDGHPTRREIQVGFNKIGRVLDQLHAADDTASIIINFICERKLADPNDPETMAKLRKEVEEFVEEKKKLAEEALKQAQIAQINPDAKINTGQTSE